MAAAASRPSSRWLYGPFTDLLLGCGLWYFAAFEIFAVYGAEIRLGGGLVLAPMLMLLLGVPHHGATLLRVYESRHDRRAYTFFAVHASILIWVLFAVGVHSDLVGSLILTVFLTWSPWHYTGQNYGIAVMFLRRNEVPLAAHAKRWLHATFILSYLLTVLVMHHGDAGTSYTPLPYDTSGYNFLSLQIPWARYLFLGVGGAYGVSLAALFLLLRRRASLAQLAPSAWMVASQALWFSIPVVVRSWNLSTGVDVLDSDPEYYFLWIGVAHAVQYLWITSYYARAAPQWSGPLRYLGKAALAGAAVWTVPSLVFAPGALGRLPFDAGLAALVAATVNLQHFVLDGAIWKLRDGRVAKVLIRSVPDAQADQPPVSWPSTPRRPTSACGGRRCAATWSGWAGPWIASPGWVVTTRGSGSLSVDSGCAAARRSAPSMRSPAPWSSSLRWRPGAAPGRPGRRSVSGRWPPRPTRRPWPWPRPIRRPCSTPPGRPGRKPAGRSAPAALWSGPWPWTRDARRRGDCWKSWSALPLRRTRLLREPAGARGVGRRAVRRSRGRTGAPALPAGQGVESWRRPPAGPATPR